MYIVVNGLNKLQINYFIANKIYVMASFCITLFAIYVIKSKVMQLMINKNICKNIVSQ